MDKAPFAGTKWFVTILNRYATATSPPFRDETETTPKLNFVHF